MKQKVIIRSLELKDRCKFLIDQIPEKPLHQMIIRPFHEKHSESQRGLYFKWVGIIAAEFGETKDQMHWILKKTHLHPIFMTTKPNYAQLLDLILNFPHGIRYDQFAIKACQKQIWDMLSINQANTKEMYEFMHDVYFWAQGMKIYLPLPEDRNMKEEITRR